MVKNFSRPFVSQPKNILTNIALGSRANGWEKQLKRQFWHNCPKIQMMVWWQYTNSSSGLVQPPSWIKELCESKVNMMVSNICENCCVELLLLGINYSCPCSKEYLWSRSSLLLWSLFQDQQCWITSVLPLLDCYMCLWTLESTGFRQSAIHSNPVCCCLFVRNYFNNV